MLGPLEVLDDDGAPVPLGGRRPRALLAQLLLQPNGVVSTDRLIDGIWGESPPASAQNALQVHVHALRSALGADRIHTRQPGYLARVDEGELDAERFERLVAAGELHDALALWRGPALADLAYENSVQPDIQRLDELRLAALEERIPEFDVVVTTAAVPGRPAPKLIPRSAVENMRSGSVIVDLAAETGGNCEVTVPGEDVVHAGVTVIGTTNLPSLMAYHASQLYSRNVGALLAHLAPEGELTLDWDDEITSGACVTRPETTP